MRNRGYHHSSIPVCVVLRISTKVDSISLQPFTQEEWKSHQYQSIEKIRKSKVKLQAVNSEGKPLANRTLTVAQKFTNFPFGFVINKNILENSDYQNCCRTSFRLFTSGTHQLFICEQKLYNKAQLKQHINTCDSEVDGSESERDKKRKLPLNPNKGATGIRCAQTATNRQKLISLGMSHALPMSRVTLVIVDGTRSIHTTISTPNVEIFKPFKPLELKKTEEEDDEHHVLSIFQFDDEHLEPVCKLKKSVSLKFEIIDSAVTYVEDDESQYCTVK
ncbi:hypothetical protein Tco_0252585 [Tanacetum coccineum]